ncbi:unnamed protein product [Auanema sp. JU1783]|nr:unnamed protein product [Auanema sp. JU1783]
MLCFLCSFPCRCSTYCYCAPGRLVRVVSTPDVIAGNRSRKRKNYRRSRSEPMLQTFENLTQFRRFRSLREKRDEKIIENGIRMSPVSIASSTEKRWSQKRAIRSRVEQRLESMLSSSSGSIPHMETELPPLNLNEIAVSDNLSTGVSSNSSSELAFEDSKSSIDVETHRHLTGDMDNETFQNEDPLEKSIDEEIERLKEIARNLNITDMERLNLRTDMQDSDIPNGWHNPINYTFELEQYMQKENLNPFADPFEEDDRRSRIEMWVESTSPGIPDSDNDPGNPMPDSVSEDASYIPSSSVQQILVPEVRVEECSENSLSSPPITDSKADKSTMESSVKPVELLENAKESKIERMDSLQTEEFASETTSFISSELDRVSLVKMNFKTNLDKALEGNDQTIHINDIERFWDYRYASAGEPDEKEEERNQEQEQNARLKETSSAQSNVHKNTLSPKDYQNHRSPTPTVERVVLYYTSDKRPSLTPSPSPSILTLSPGCSERDPVEKSDHEQEDPKFIFPVIQNPPSSILIVVDEDESDIDFDLPGSPNTCLTSDGLENDEQSEDESRKMEEYVRNKKLHSRSHRSKSSSSESSIIIGVTNDLTPTLRSSYFQLDQDSASDSEEGHVVDLDGIEFSMTSLPTADNERPKMVSRATSTNDLIFEEANRKTTSVKTESRQPQQPETSISAFPLENNSKYSAKKAVNVRKSERRSQSSKRYINWRWEKLSRLSPNVSSSTKTIRSEMSSTPIIIEDKVSDDDVSSADQDVELRLFDGRVLDNIESSSTEDLLALDIRPSSAGRKSVSFSEKVKEEIVSPDSRRKSVPPTSPVSLCVTARPILKKEDKHRETLHKLMCHAAERLYKDLRMLIEERDRSVHAIDLVPNDIGDLSAHSGTYQSQYREKLLQNKDALDRRISEVWIKLKELPLDNSKSNFVYSVNDSSLLTLNARRRILQRRISFQQPSISDRVGRSDHLEMASDYATRLAHMRERMIRRDSEVRKEDDRSVEEILQRVSRALYG